MDIKVCNKKSIHKKFEVYYENINIYFLICIEWLLQKNPPTS